MEFNNCQVSFFRFFFNCELPRTLNNETTTILIIFFCIGLLITEWLSFESPLDLKLRADVLGSSVLFIGYSLSDINIRLLFYKLSKMWSGQSLQSVRPKSYLFSHRPNPVDEEILRHRGIEMVISDDSSPATALKVFLEDLIS